MPIVLPIYDNLVENTVFCSVEYKRRPVVLLNENIEFVGPENLLCLITIMKYTAPKKEDISELLSKKAQAVLNMVNEFGRQLVHGPCKDVDISPLELAVIDLQNINVIKTLKIEKRRLWILLQKIFLV